MNASEAYVRRLLASQQLYGIKIGPVWGVYPEDLESFRRMRRPPGRPPKARRRAAGEAETRLRITRERAAAGTDSALLKSTREPARGRPMKNAPRESGTANGGA